MKKILMVCMGNVCRSPIAEAVARSMAKRAGLASELHFDSAGTHCGQVGETPDTRAMQVAAKHGYKLSGLRARKVNIDDFGDFDHILAMDRANLKALERICPFEHRFKLELFTRYAQGLAGEEIPDPYYGSIEGFERVIDLCEASARGLIATYANEPRNSQSLWQRLRARLQSNFFR